MSTHMLAGKNAKIIWESWKIKTGSTLVCLGGAIYHPNNFFVCCKHSWNGLEALMKEMRKFYIEGIVPSRRWKKEQPAEKNPHFTPDPKTLQRGMFVAVFHRREWHRGIILQSYDDIKQYKIMMIDYGDHKNCPLSNIRYISQLFLDKLPAQAIKCTFLTASKPLTRGEIHWTADEAKDFVEALGKANIEIEFVNCDVEEVLLIPIIWQVRIRRKRTNGTMLELKEIPVGKRKKPNHARFKSLTSSGPIKPSDFVVVAGDATTDLTKDFDDMSL